MFQCTQKVRDIMYFMLIYYSMLTSFAFSAMVLFAPSHEGFGTINDSIRSLQRMATNEISLTAMIKDEA